MRADNERILRGEEPTEESENRVDDMPQAFKDWVEKNQERIMRARSLPYFLRDNGTIGENGYMVRSFGEKKARVDKSEEYNHLLNSGQYKEVFYSRVTGGLKAVHIGHADHSNPNETLFFGALSSTDLEQACQNELYKLGYSAILQNEMILGSEKKMLPALDLMLDGKLMDIRAITQIGSSTIRNILNAKSKQLKRVFEKTGVEADAVCLYFHDGTMFSEYRVLQGISDYKSAALSNKGVTTTRIRKVYCVVRGSERLRIYPVK